MMLFVFDVSIILVFKHFKFIRNSGIKFFQLLKVLKDKFSKLRVFSKLMIELLSFYRFDQVR